MALPARIIPLRTQPQSPAKGLDLASELFHRINRMIPVDQEVLTIPHDCPVREALALMEEHNFSQLPVAMGGEVLGVFSHRSFARGSAKVTLGECQQQRAVPGDQTVDEFLDTFSFKQVTEEISRTFGPISQDNCLLVGAPDNLLGILTPMDFLLYLHRVAMPFVLVSEVELALRAIIRLALGEDGIPRAAQACLLSAYGLPEKIPATLEDMTFHDYQTLVTHGDTWPRFAPFLGGNQALVRGKVKISGDIRNVLFHFKRELSPDERRSLEQIREWLLLSVRKAKLRQPEEAHG